ncbi:MAG: dihydrodipicolinate reductase [Bacilli bacterium]|jgi:hypothetical protein|nr:dihydrodipicolinate reductase [Bacilli bacterium]
MGKYKVIQVGCGKMSTYTMKYALDKGYEIVGALDISSELIGKDIGNVLGNGDTGVVIEDIANLNDLISRVKPDIAIVTTTSLIGELDEILTTLASNGVNAITTCEEAFYPSVSNPILTEKLDKLAKDNNCTITGTGYQDVFWGNLIYTLGGATHTITKIKGSSSYNVEDYGIALAKAHGAGLSKEEFDKTIAAADNISDNERQELINNGTYTPSYMWNVVPWLADRFGLSLIRMSQKCVPIIAEEDIDSSTLGTTIKKGFATGMSAIVCGETKEGIVIEAECIGKVYGENDVDTNAWTIEGEPSTSVVITKPDTVRLTCASVVNRIEDVILSNPGYVPTSQMGEIEYINR